MSWLRILPILALALVFCVDSSMAAAQPCGGASEDAHFANYKRSLPAACLPEAVQETVQCDACRSAAITEIDPELYANWVNHHFNPLVSKYYNAQQGLAFMRSCPVDANLPITTPWLARFGGIALDEDQSDVIVRICTFPTETEPFICVGSPGTPGTYGRSLGTLSYTAILTNSPNRGEGIWALFCQCWDASTPTRVGTNFPVSWNVFSLRPTISQEHLELILAKLRSLNFNVTNVRVNNYATLFDEP